MANELTINANLAYEDSEGSEHPALGVVADQATITTKKYVQGKISVGTTEEAVPLGEVTSLGWAVFKNLDATNFVEIRTGTGGTKFCKISPGEAACFRFGSGVTAPYIIADTGACQVEYRIYST